MVKAHGRVSPRIFFGATCAHTTLLYSNLTYQQTTYLPGCDVKVSSAWRHRLLTLRHGFRYLTPSLHAVLKQLWC